MTLTHSVTAFPSATLPKIDKYRAVSMKLNWTSLADIANAGLTAAAAWMRSLRAVAAVWMEIVDWLKCEATVSQIVSLKLWLSPK